MQLHRRLFQYNVLYLDCLGENGVFAAMGRVQAGGGDMGQGGRGDCCNIEVSSQSIY